MCSFVVTMCYVLPWGLLHLLRHPRSVGPARLMLDGAHRGHIQVRSLVVVVRVYAGYRIGTMILLLVQWWIHRPIWRGGVYGSRVCGSGLEGWGRCLPLWWFCWARSSIINSMNQNSSQVITHSVKKRRVKQVLAQKRDYSISIRQEDTRNKPMNRADDIWYKSLSSLIISTAIKRRSSCFFLFLKTLKHPSARTLHCSRAHCCQYL